MTLPLLPAPAEPPRCRRCHRACRHGTTAGYGPECAAIVGLVTAGRSRAVAGSGPNLLDLINEGAAMTDTPTSLADLPHTAAEISHHLRQAGYTGDPVIRDTVTLAEEAGELVGAVRRYTGMARRSGTLDDVAAEAADVVLTVAILAHDIGFDLAAAVAAKVEVIYARGWREPVPDSAGV